MVTGDGVMADGLNFCLEEGEAREPGWEEVNQEATTARSGGLTVDVSWNPVNQRMCTEKGWCPLGQC